MRLKSSLMFRMTFHRSSEKGNAVTAVTALVRVDVQALSVFLKV